MGNRPAVLEWCKEGCAGEGGCWAALRFKFWRQRGDLFISGFRRRRDGTAVGQANGEYRLHGENHGRPVYQHCNGTGPFVYFWDRRDGAKWSGWWLGPSVGSAIVWAFCPDSDIMPQISCEVPPGSGWQAPWQGPVDPKIRVELASPNSEPRLSGVDSPNVEPEKSSQEVLPHWLQAIPRPEVPAVCCEDPRALQSCCICLEPLWNARPSVFLVNLRRLCSHYFCRACAQRVVGEQSTLIEFLREGYQLALVDRLPMVIDGQTGMSVGDLVWSPTGVRLSEGELAVVLDQLYRLVELEEGMELRFVHGEALVLHEGVLFGQLLRCTGRALQRISEEDFFEAELAGAVTGFKAAELYGRYAVLRGSVSDGWTCARCTVENAAAHFRCVLCTAARPPPDCPSEASRRLTAADLSSLRSRFAVRPHINWAVPLQCPLCRSQGVASVKELPDLRVAPQEWFHLADLRGEGRLSASELARAIAAVLPLSPDRLEDVLEGRSEPAVAGLPRVAAEGIYLEEFLQDLGPAQWVAQHLAELSALANESGWFYGRETNMQDYPAADIAESSGWEALRQAMRSEGVSSLDAQGVSRLRQDLRLQRNGS
mmetsp:Transcript_66071/g.118978  ORF Transcript_66071/g.118978 Transcript_66071/m.118978 type:complete len:598 (-) Transcript_66071:14-1807(-)